MERRTKTTPQIAGKVHIANFDICRPTKIYTEDNLPLVPLISVLFFQTHIDLSDVCTPHAELTKGPSIKYVTLQGGGGLRKCDSL